MGREEREREREKREEEKGSLLKKVGRQKKSKERKLITEGGSEDKKRCFS